MKNTVTRIIKGLITILLLSATLTSFAQQTFDYQRDFKAILAKTSDAADSLYYNKLVRRFESNDSALTNYEMLALLIAFTANKEYKPYEDLSTEREIYKLNAEHKYQEALEKGLSFLKTHPLSVKALFEIGYAYHKLDQNDKAQLYVYKGHKIFEAMYFSGNGQTKETPTFALGPADGQDYINKFIGADIGTMGSGKDKHGNFLDILQVKFSDSNTITMYFIIQHAADKIFSSDNANSFEQELKQLKELDARKKKKAKK
ncbi:MAG: hypothetical protein RL660_1728 [Bacteroidota bacterium]